MLIELSPMMLHTLERINELHLSSLNEDDHVKAKRLWEERGRDVMCLLIELNEAVNVAETKRSGVAQAGINVSP